MPCNHPAAGIILFIMNLEKHCLKHPYIETDVSCIRCKTSLCPDCRIREVKEPYCSFWCLYHDKAEKTIKSFTKGMHPWQGEERERLIFFSNMVMALIIVFFTTASLYFYEQEKSLTLSKTGQKPEKIHKKEVALVHILKRETIKETEPVKKSKEMVSPPKKRVKTLPPKVPQRKERKIVIHLPPNISRVAEAGKKISITFDGGSSDSSATIILDVLSEKKIKTTFFLTGRFIKRYPHLVKRMLDEGHEIGNHTYNHPHLTTYSKNRKNITSTGVNFQKLKKELEKTAHLYEEVTGEKMAPFWRAPYGEINDEILQWASQIGYQHIAWTVDYKARQSMDSLDWVADRNSSLYLSAEEIKERLLSFADEKGRARGGIILMHLGTERKEDAAHEKLAEIIDDFTLKGYKLVPVSYLVKVINKESKGNKL